MSEIDLAYNFVFRGLLAEEALDEIGRIHSNHSRHDIEKISDLVGLTSLDEELVVRARAMATVYIAISAFENSVRKLIIKVLTDTGEADWWNKYVSDKIREAAISRMKEEEKIKWHAQRGADPIQYTMLPNLINIMRNNIQKFEPFIHDIEWAASIFDTIERSRNVIMHSGYLQDRDVARVGSAIRDWSAQVAV